MEKTARNFGRFLDEMRSSRNISRENFTDEIISIRQYQRYISGETSINNEKLFKLIDRLNMDLQSVYRQFIKMEDEELSLIKQMYSFIKRDEYLNAEKILNSLNKENIMSQYNRNYYTFCEILIQQNLKKISKDMAISSLKKLANYPLVLEQSTLSFVELITLLDLSYFLISKENDKKIAEYLFNILKGNDISSSIPDLYLPSIYAHVAKNLGSLKEYEKTILIADKGIQICRNLETFNSLAHIYSFKAIALDMLNRRDEAIIEIKNLFKILDIENKPQKTKAFETYVQKQFNLKITDL